MERNTIENWLFLSKRYYVILEEIAKYKEIFQVTLLEKMEEKGIEKGVSSSSLNRDIKKLYKYGLIQKKQQRGVGRPSKDSPRNNVVWLTDEGKIFLDERERFLRNITLMLDRLDIDRNTEHPFKIWLSAISDEKQEKHLLKYVKKIKHLVNANHGQVWHYLNDILDALSNIYGKCKEPDIDLTHWEVVKSYLGIWELLYNSGDFYIIEDIGAIDQLSSFIEIVIPSKENRTIEQNKEEFYKMLEEILSRYEGNKLPYDDKRMLPNSLIDLFLNDLTRDTEDKIRILERIKKPQSNRYAYQRLEEKVVSLDTSSEEKELCRLLLDNPHYAEVI